MALAPLAWFAGASAVLDAADGADALILIDAARGGPDLAVIAAAANRADPRLPDAVGDHWPGDVLAPGGAARLAAGLDATVFARALTLAGLSVALSEPRDAGVANHCLYTLARRGALAARLQIGPGCAPAVLDEALRAAALFAGACAEVRATAAV
jgi:pyrrolidone-carboxylate peptidase